MPMDRSLYPANWDAIAHQVKEERFYQRQQAREEQIQAGQLILPALSEVTL